MRVARAPMPAMPGTTIETVQLSAEHLKPQSLRLKNGPGPLIADRDRVSFP